MKNLLIVLVLFCFGLSCKTAKKAVQQPEPAPVEEVVQKIEEPVKEEPVILMPETEEPIVMKTEEVRVIEEEKPPVEPSYDFFVIIGSFQKPENAEKCKTNMAGKGYTPVLLSTKSGFFRVAIEQTNSETDARTFIKKIRTQYPEHKDVWLLKKK
ncbi:MAG TPA: SPOR domain-containing protein [Prolixibacteraceae bacterium]|nr:SPOR domain-containing protein [Prolixibacteraceae bacterium]